jgi:uncharacterized protein YbcI
MFSQPQAYSDLIEALQVFCREKLGREPHRIRVDLDNDTALILLQQFLSLVEIEVAQQGEEAEKASEEQLRDMLKPHLQLMVEEATKRQVARAQIYIDFPVGNIIGVFIFTERLVRIRPQAVWPSQSP